ncbi:cytochrome P450 3A24-like [Sceloporus undulatus]|uniref:cytochrome P450 3A24-like n=1 Tax=Sceloporus undulatus TaxID=8520 RepID=UPI001C4BF92C|nr:cytochrome P450 3A24-like [Sceloporus undulatus]
MDFLPSFSLQTWVLLVVFLALFLLYGIWPYNFFKKLGIPGPKPLPFIGTFLEYRKGVLDFDQKCYQKYGKIWGIFDGRQPVMAILDPTIIKAILVKECYTHFTNRRDFGLNGDLDSSIVIVADEQWKRIRTVLSPNFTSGRLKEMFPIINHYGKMLVKNVQKRVENDESINMKDIFGAYSMDVITSTSFSINIDSINNPNDPFVINIKKIIKFNFVNPLLIAIVIFPFLKPLLETLKFSLTPRSITEFFTGAFKKIKKDRQKNGHKDRVDFLQMMLDSQSSGDISEEAKSYKALNDKEILTQAIVFVFAGYEPTSSTLSYMAYCLATHPDVQQRLQEEIDEALPNQATPVYDTLLKMEYLDMVVSETLRLYPLGGRIERVSKNTVEINGVTIPKGTVTMIPAFVLQRDPEHWPEPEEFRPERFSKENRQTLDPYVYLPFGAGPRNCIGMRFALLSLKVAAVVLLQRFSFWTCKETPIPLELDSKGFLQPKKPIKLKLVPRVVAGSG